MADNVKEELNEMADNGKLSRHPVRTAGTAFLLGIGAGMMAASMRKEKSSWQKFMGQIGM
jgi:hypothetical protein